MKQKMTLDEFFQEHSSNGFLCTLEAMPNDSDKVKVTPWIEEKEDCNCDSAIILDKQLIESVSPTENTHFCCGRKHKVVELFFKENATMKVSEIMEMLINKSRQSKQSSASGTGSFSNPAFATNPQMSRVICAPGYAQCGPYCYNPQNQCCCADPYGNITVRDNSAHQQCYYICGGR